MCGNLRVWGVSWMFICGTTLLLQGQSGALTNCAGDYEIPIEHRVLTSVKMFPTWKGCEDIEKSGKRDGCTSQRVAEFIRENTPRDMPLIGEYWVKFIVEENGCLSNIELVDPDNSEAGWVAQEIVRNMPLWIPGMDKSGVISRVAMRVPVRFGGS